MISAAAPFHAPPTQEQPRTRVTATKQLTPPIAEPAPIDLTQDQTKAVLKKGRSEIVWIMITTVAVPHHLERQDMYLNAISASIRAVVSGATANPPANYERTLSLAMRDVRHHFKTHCAHNVQHVYGLCLEDSGDDGYVDPELEFERLRALERRLQLSSRRPITPLLHVVVLQASDSQHALPPSVLVHNFRGRNPHGQFFCARWCGCLCRLGRLRRRILGGARLAC